MLKLFVSGSDFVKTFKSQSRIFKQGSRHLGESRILSFATPFIAIRYCTDLTDHGKDCVTRQNFLHEFRCKFMFTTKTVTTKKIVLFIRKSSAFHFRLYSSSPEEALSTPLFSSSEPLEFEEVPLLLASSV